MILHSLCLFVNFWRFLCLYTHELYYFCKKIPMNDTNLLNKSADNIRVLTAAMVEKAKSGHPGGAMGGADFINVLYSEFLVYDPADPKWINRDRFFLESGQTTCTLRNLLLNTSIGNKRINFMTTPFAETSSHKTLGDSSADSHRM